MESDMVNAGLLISFNVRDKNAFAEIYKLYHRAIYLFAYKIVAQVQDAEDIAAESFIKLWKSDEKFETLGNVRAFLFTITRNACLNYMKSSYRKVVSQNTVPVDEIVDTDDSFHQITAELIQIISQHLDSLPRKRRAIMQMILLQGLNDKQVAEHLEINQKTVRNQKNTAIHSLRQELSSVTAVARPGNRHLIFLLFFLDFLGN